MLERGPIRDKTNMEGCQFETASDGVTRCLPSQPSAGFFYSDMSCTTTVAAGDDACGPPATHVALSDGTCTPKYKVYALGTRADMASTMLWTKAPPGSPIPCQPFNGSGGKYVWPLGAEVAPTTFVDARLVEH